MSVLFVSARLGLRLYGEDMTSWFGKDWGAPVCRDIPHVAVPVGEKCFYCDEMFVAEDAGMKDEAGKSMHFNCFLRGLIGSVAHQQQRCSCFVEGGDESDPPEMTRRQAADAAVTIWKAMQEAAQRGLHEQPN